MKNTDNYRSGLKLGVSLLTFGASFLAPVPAFAQVAEPGESAAEAPATGETSDEKDIIVTGSRIERAGFDQPTPTTVISSTEIRQAAQPNLQQVLNEQPQVRNSTSQESSGAGLNSGQAPVDLRGLGAQRTLTLVNGRRFVGNNNLNFIPTNLVERIELVTGGASAAWGSGAVAGVVNIRLNDDLEGITLGADAGISSRGDGFRYGFDGAYGTRFAGGNGHFMIGAEYVHDKGIGSEGMDERPWFGADFVNVTGGRELRPNVNNNLVVAGSPVTFGGTVLTGVLAGQVFEPSGALRAQRPGDAINLYKTLSVKAPLERFTSYARASYDVGDNAMIWADFAYGKVTIDQPFLPDPAGAGLVFNVSATNPFLSQTIQDQLRAAGQTSFLMGRFSRDTFLLQFDAKRQTIEGAIGIEGSLGDGWKYDAHYSHGESKNRARVHNSLIVPNFLNAIDAVQTPGGFACAINADATTANDDPACVAFNPFGEDAAFDAAKNYVRGTQSSDTTDKLDSVAFRIQGSPLSLWAGPINIAAGVEARWEETVATNGELDRLGAASIFGTSFYRTPISGGTNVKEAFGELLLPLLDAEELKVELNGAARYSDYNRSGGIWSWKIGGTARIFDSLLLRATNSRDIRAPSVNELFSVDSISVRQVVDRDPPAGAVDGVDGYEATPVATVLIGGNPNLVPEISKTWTIGGSFSPSFLQGFSLSVDYYDIKIGGAIAAPDTQDITSECVTGNAEACARVTRDASGTITQVHANNANIARFSTNGIDIEASYLLPLSRVSNLPGSLRFRALASWVDELLFETPASILLGTSRQTAGSVGDTVLSGVPHWRGVFSATYQNDSFGFDARLRYVGGGKFDASQTDILNNKVNARTYFDLGAQFKVADRFTFFGNVRNVFDIKPPLTVQVGGYHYDTIGRYFTAGVRLNF